MNQKLLQDSAAATGAKMITFTADPDVKGLLGEARKTMATRFDKSLWDTWAALLVFMVLFATEWFLRKRWYLD